MGHTFTRTRRLYGSCGAFGLRTGGADGSFEVALAGTCAVAVDGLPIFVGRWHLVALAYDGASWFLYVDGALAASGDAALDTALGPLVLGGTLEEPFYGSVDDLFALDVALTPAQALELYETFASVPTDAPTAAATAAPTRSTAAPTPDNSCGHNTGLSFSEVVVDDDSRSPSYAWPVDLDQDGDMDVLATSLHDDTVAWYGNDGLENFDKHVITDEAVSAAFGAFNDLDGDGHQDVIAVSWGDNMTRVFLNVYGNMTFEEHAIDDTVAPVSVNVEDMDGDGADDVVTSSWSHGTMHWYERLDEDEWADHGAGYLKHTAADDLAGPWFVFPGDVDGDADVDVLVATGYDFSVSWYDNDGAQNFDRRVVDTEVVQPRMVIARDADGDGDVDLFVAIRGAGKVVWYDNDGDEAFTSHTVCEGADGAYSVIPVDLDGDRDVDVLTANKYDATIAWYENDGDMGFSTHKITTQAEGVRFAAMSDIDGDYDLDVVGAIAERNTVAWYHNLCEGQTYAKYLDSSRYWGVVTSLSAKDSEGRPADRRVRRRR